MRAKAIGFGLLLVAVAVATAALYARSRGAVLPWIGGPPIETVIDRAIVAGDSTAVATFAVDRCKLLRGKQRQRCYEEILFAMTERQKVRLAMDAMSVLSRMDPSSQRYGHDLAHVVGINSWKPKRDVSNVYDQCTGLYQSGCYHGVVQAYLDAKGTDSATVAGLCNEIKPAVFNMWLRFQCVHGLGHGLVNNLNHHLPKALSGCDWLVDSWDQQSCYGGAFMEFIVAGRGQSHHPHASQAKPADPAAAGAGEHHDEHADHGATADSFAYRDRGDPLYPCTAIDLKYQSACYAMQAGIVIELTGPDFGKIAAACNDAPVPMQPSCYQGVGTYVSGFTVRDPEKAIRFCSQGDPKLQTWCYVGVVKNFIDVTADPKDGLDFCARLGNRDYAVGCYNAVGEEMSVLFPDMARREQQCAKAPAEFAPACRYGATLSPDRPKELTPFMPTS